MTRLAVMVNGRSLGSVGGRTPMMDEGCNAYCTEEVHVFRAANKSWYTEAQIHHFWQLVWGEVLVRWAPAREADRDQWMAMDDWVVPLGRTEQLGLLWLRCPTHVCPCPETPMTTRLLRATMEIPYDTPGAD